jgi:hypothetical protein
MPRPLLPAVLLAAIISFPAFAQQSEGLAHSSNPRDALPALNVGGFNATRGGGGSIDNNVPLRNLILSQYPGSTFSSTSTLTPAYLSTVNRLIISVGIAATKAIAPLSSAEQSALVDFVKGGGTALLFCDNNTFDSAAPTVNASFLSPFSLSMTGTLSSNQSSRIVNPSNPVATGPAGTATGFDTLFPGWFTSLGNAVAVAVLTTNNMPDIAVLMPGMLAAGSGAVVFFADGNNIGGFTQSTTTANNNILVLNSLALQAASGVTKILPQLAFGGGWYTALYLTNTTTAPVSAGISFTGDDGNPLTVGGIGASTTVNLAPRGTAIIEAPNTGPLVQGYISASLPAGVTGYGVFRQSLAGVNDQEAVVPLSGLSATASTLVFDDTKYVTGVAVVNLSSASATITATAHDAQGNTLGNGTISLSLNAKKALVLRDLIPAVAGNMGSVDFSTSIGNLAALGLRFNGTAFTSIPTSDR